MNFDKDAAACSQQLSMTEARRASAPQGAGFYAAGDVGVNAETVVGEHIVKVVVEKQTAVFVELNKIHADAAHKFVL